MALLRRDPFKEELDSLLAEYSALETTYSERSQRIDSYRDEANHVREPNLYVQTADLTDYGRRPRADGLPHRHRIPLPLGKAITVKHAFRIAGRLPDVVVDQRDSSPEEAYRSDSVEKIVWAVIRASRGETTLSSASWNASEIGAACLDLYFDYKRNMPIFRSVDPALLDPHALTIGFARRVTGYKRPELIFHEPERSCTPWGWARVTKRAACCLR